MKKNSITNIAFFEKFQMAFRALISLNWGSYLILAMLVVLLATSLRFYQLGQFPHGMTWDEAAIGYNGFAIFHTRRDEWLAKLPVSFKSFGDYKSPLAIYVNGISTFLFGMNLWAVRFPFALAGVLSVAGIMAFGYLLAKEQFSEKNARLLSLVLGLMLAISPWALHFSRVAFESGMALCLVIWGMMGLLAFFHLSESEWQYANKLRWIALIGSVVSFAASLYTYHSAKIVVPLLLVVTMVYCWPAIKKNLMQLSLAGLVGFALLIPLLKDTFMGAGGSRFIQASFLGQHLPPMVLLQTFTSHFLIHFSPAYLLFGATVTFRHGDGHWGVLFWPELVLVVAGVSAGLWQLVLKLTRTKKVGTGITFAKEIFLGLAWVVIGTLPAAIGVDVPHSNRGLLALPGFLILAVFGGLQLIKWLNTARVDQVISGSKGEKHLFAKSIIGCLILCQSLLFMSYLHDYYGVFSRQSANDFQDGYLQAFQFAVKNEASSDQIVISDHYGQSYIFALFVRQTNPIWYQGGIMSKYLYLPKVSESDLSRKNTVIIATPDEILPKYADQLVYGSDGKIKFVLVKTK